MSSTTAPTQHTPGEWSLVSHYRKPHDLHIHVGGPSGGPAIEFAKGWDDLTPTEQANATRIVKAVNMHDELLACIKDLSERLNLDGYDQDNVRLKNAMRLLKQAESK